MHPTRIFRQVSREANLAFARDQGFGVLTVGADDEDGPLLSHVPFLLTEDCSAVHAHLTRANPILCSPEKGERPAVMAVSGPDSYISPDWYEADPGLVPTWNYVAVHLRGRLRLRPQETLRDHLEALAMQFEQRLHPKPPWRITSNMCGGFCMGSPTRPPRFGGTVVMKSSSIPMHRRRVAFWCQT
ncbi:MAG: FMN-binding negative transcriptional regulator [Gammaproteobacteria bacterium]|nr:FMN-binding negative transcriptional regulator [Gammaproteobacteria bacterium]